VEVKVMEKGAQLLNNVSAGCLHKIVNNCPTKMPVFETNVLSNAACDSVIVTYTRVLIKDVL